ncbi:hypothetical protein P4639_22075 [Priestia megaterium]|uniref:hypothetical protein n=1 Tax=Priestia megaterium TaxID=1404 RepID=UPI002E24C6FA|nr:hypothetical protein [Priestia megaterium]
MTQKELRNLAKEIQSVNKKQPTEWLDRREYEEMYLKVGEKRLKNMKEFDEYCNSMNGEVDTYHISELEK